MRASGAQQDQQTETFPEEIILDNYQQAVTQARAMGSPVSKVVCNIGRGTEFGVVKCSFTVSVEVPQTKEYMDQAAELVFRKALEYTNDGMSHLAPGIDRIEM